MSETGNLLATGPLTRCDRHSYPGFDAGTGMANKIILLHILEPGQAAKNPTINISRYRGENRSGILAQTSDCREFLS